MKPIEIEIRFGVVQSVTNIPIGYDVLIRYYEDRDLTASSDMLYLGNKRAATEEELKADYDEYLDECEECAIEPVKFEIWKEGK